MTSAAYLDTSVIVSWATASVSPSEPIDSRARTRVNELLALPSCEVAVSELTLIEYTNKVYTLWRAPERQQLDESWAEESISALMGKIADRRLQVVQTPPKAAEHALTLVKMATRDRRANFRAWDAVHLINATSWALTRDPPSTLLVTTDSDFRKFVEHYQGFKAYIEIEQVRA